VAISGCSRAKYRVQADREAYQTIAEKNVDPRWCEADYSIEIDPRSRYFDRYDPDCPPMPPDDPASHRYMHCVDGKKGWKHWHDNGVRKELENPEWYEALPYYVEITDDGAVKLTLDSALKLAYVHSPLYQSQLETLYLSSLDVTTERFRFDTQFFGGYDARYAHNGSLIPAALRFVPTLGRFEVNPPIDGEGVENNRLTVGRPFAADPVFQAQRRCATAGEFLVGFANSFVFEFTGSDANLAASLANFTFAQPLLRGAGRDVALEQLTVAERALLANLRAYHQYRQGFFTQVAVGEVGVAGPQRGGAGTNVAVFPGQGSLRGYVGLLQQLQEIRNSEDNLSLQERTLAQLEALEEIDLIDLVQVDQFRQDVETSKSRLLLLQNAFENTLDSYKKDTIGLPPDLPVDLDDSLIRQFQLVTPEATAVQDSLFDLQDRVGELPDDAGAESIRQILTETSRLVEPVRRQLDDVQSDLARMDQAVPERERSMTAEEREQFRRDVQQQRKTLADLEQEFGQEVADLDRLRVGLSDQTRAATTRRLAVWLGDFSQLVLRSILVQARARLEAVTIETIELGPRDAFEIALASRLDFMNARAALVDSWRLIQFNADALQSVLNVTASGEIRTARNNAVSFRAPTGNLRLGLEFDAPLTRLLERNDYRESLINYQRNRRAFIQSRDSLHLGLRALLRDIEQLRKNLEIQRRAVVIAIRQVDLTRARLYAPVPPPPPGQRAAQFGRTTARDTREAQASLLNTRNNFLSVWLNYYAAKMRLARELGIMTLDEDGRWIDRPLPGSSRDGSVDGDTPAAEELPLPPPVPTGWIDLVDYIQPLSGGSPLDDKVRSAQGPAPIHPTRVFRLPPTDETSDTNGYSLLQKSN
jgi:hypothetical protein